MASATREKIVTSADRLFYERGYEATSFADVSEAVGISRGNFYYHFKTKDQILDAVIEIRSFGCPIGTLFAEMAKLDHPGAKGARELFDLFRIWLCRRFEDMGRRSDADALAMHLLARSQGVATLANAYPEERFLENEVDQMLSWLDAVADQTDKSS